MTLGLAVIVAFTGAVGVASFVAALWGALESTEILSHLRTKEADPEDIALAKLMIFRSNARALLVLVLSFVSVLRLAAEDLLVTASTYVMFGLLLFAQVIVALFVLLDVYERTSIFLHRYDKQGSKD